MPQANKKEANKSSEEKAQSQISEKHAQLRSKAEAERGQQGRRTGFIIGAVVVIVILTILGGSYYQNYVAPFQRTIITVDNTVIRMDYFIKRARLAAVQPMEMLEALTREEIIKLAAPRYGIAVTPEDIVQELRGIARTTLERETISESEFREWYRQQLNESQLSDAEFKEIVTIGLWTMRLQEYLAERMPTVAEHVRLYAILAPSLAEAQQIRARWEAGADFRDLARELSLDKEAKETGGELGWIPRGVLEPRLEFVAFDLKPGEVSIPIPAVVPSPTAEGTTEGGYFLFLVSEKADSREVDEEYLPMLKSGVLEPWYLEEIQLHKVSYKFNSEINAWINWQLAKSQPSSTGHTGQELTP